ncbi:MAG: hypothetical protein ABS939_02660 [Psychrobacillus sp.]
MTLLEIAKKHMIKMQNTLDFELSDYSLFGSYVRNLEELDDASVKPHLVIIYENMWGYMSEFVSEAMETLGYEYVGRMGKEHREENDTFIFECEDSEYDSLYRLKDNNADYTKILKF